MQFFLWHYTSGLRAYLHRWRFLMAWVVHYFSLTILLPTLFSPWRRMTDTANIVGFNLSKLLEQLSFNIISRCIGAIVRLFLFIIGFLLLFPCFIAGLAGFICWLIFPFIGLPYYWYSDRHGKKFINRLATLIFHQPGLALQFLLDNTAGRFFLTHLNLSQSDFIALATPAAKLSSTTSLLQSQSYRSLLENFVSAGFFDEVLLRKHKLETSDLLVTATWWDEQHLAQKDERFHFNRPGLGLELLFGYTPQLNTCSTDLSLSQPFSHHLVARENIVTFMEDAFTTGKSVILYGEPGVGKKTVVLEFARRAMAGELGSRLAYHRVLEFDYNFLLSDSLDLNKKKSRLSEIFAEASSAGNIILMIKDLHRLVESQLEGVDFTDILETHLEKRKIKIIAVSSTVEYQRFLSRNLRLRKYFEPIEIPPPQKDQARQILQNMASDIEKSRHLVITIQALNAIVDGCDRYITDTPFPEKALEILDHVVTYAENNSLVLITDDHVTQVLAERTGIPLAHLTQQEKQLLANLEEAFAGQLVGQKPAVSLIAKSLRARSVGVKDQNRPVGSFLFLGPTGVGKTQTARTLAKIYYGSNKEIIRFDMSEYIGSEGLEKLIGSAARNQPGLLPTAISKKPASLLLLDEIEKASPEIFNLFLTLLDEGYITDAFGKKIICRHLFVIATSNAGAEFIRQQVAKKVPDQSLQASVLEYVQANHIFSPEFINRFDGVVVFEPLTQDQLVKIAKLMLADLQASLKSQNIYLEITDQLCQKVAQDSYVPEFGARPMRRTVDLVLGDVLGKAILSGQIDSGDHIQIIPSKNKDEYAVAKL